MICVSSNDVLRDNASLAGCGGNGGGTVQAAGCWIDARFIGDAAREGNTLPAAAAAISASLFVSVTLE
jgi:hypothetical protein